jgi:hypothetical protein
LQKARTCAFFSDGAVAYAARSIGWLAQPHFPPGIDTTAPGPLFGMQAIYNPNGNLLHPAMNGFEVFPGGLPIFKSGILVGGVGISGDGVDQDDQIAFGGQLPPFSAPTNVRCDVVDEVFVVSSLRDFGLSKMRNATDAAIGRIDGNIAAPIAITGLAPTGAALGIARGQLVALRDLIDAKRVELQDPGRLTGVPIPWFKFARKPNLFDSK